MVSRFELLRFCGGFFLFLFLSKACFNTSISITLFQVFYDHIVCIIYIVYHYTSVIGINVDLFTSKLSLFYLLILTICSCIFPIMAAIAYPKMPTNYALQSITL